DASSLPLSPSVPNRVDDRQLANAFQKLHAAIDELRLVVEPAARFARLIDEAAASQGGTIADTSEP
ncbi:MAG TPA: hypothetical protein VH208_05610, partial [Myxococcaceae bacterium]|nr:hypothetical protein [Myxococcaceae bacterium]